MKLKNYVLVAVVGISFSCTQQSATILPSWNETPIKQQLINYINVDVDKIPVEDRIAVFDMDGTIACERPLGFEMVTSVHRMIERGEKEPSIKETTEYKFAKLLSVNPRDTAVFNHCYVNGKNFMDNITMKSFEGMDNEDYVAYAHTYLNKASNQKFGIKYADMFYQPMLELINVLKEKHFQIYVVSGSMQGLVWSVCPQNIGLDREHLLGTYINMNVSFTKNGKVSYKLKNEMLQPKNNYYGKAVNIYNHIGKTPVVAIGNTSGDFGMFHMASCSKYPHLVLMLNHDDDIREYAYAPHKGNTPHWRDSLRINGWLQADMSKEFKVVWKQKKG